MRYQHSYSHRQWRNSPFRILWWQTDLVKASQWSRGDDVAPAIAEALDKQLVAHLAKKK